MNFGAMVFTVLAYGIFIYERGRVALWIWEGTTYLLLFATLLDLSCATRSSLEGGRSSETFGIRDQVTPQPNPLAFVFHGRSVQVQDWGVGFEPEKVEPQRLGLQGVRQTVERLGGTVEIDSRPGMGTCIFVEVPLSDRVVERASR